MHGVGLCSPTQLSDVRCVLRHPVRAGLVFLLWWSSLAMVSNCPPVPSTCQNSHLPNGHEPALPSSMALRVIGWLESPLGISTRPSPNLPSNSHVCKSGPGSERHITCHEELPHPPSARLSNMGATSVHISGRLSAIYSCPNEGFR
ncbi:hypothetical protein F4778DRAFT_103977 [Xylariomycetidae sp. FL2044]|nr:hypothetical protein F4778DRAFT_103977 [Xylariomycetidae sp. FL2044]